MTYSDEVLKLNPELATTLQTVPASKYHNAQAEANGMRFQSGKEAIEIGKLILAEKHKAIFALRLQVKFPLQGNNSYTAGLFIYNIYHYTTSLTFFTQPQV